MEERTAGGRIDDVPGSASPGPVTAVATDAGSVETDSVEAQLDRLQRESEERRAELRAIAAELPEARSRRQVVATMARDARVNADIGAIVTRAFRKLARAPRAIGRRLRRS